MRCFIAAVHLCAAVYIGAVLYRPASVVAAPVASWLKTDKAQDRLPVKRVPTESYVLAIRPEPVRSPWNCAQVRKGAEDYGREAVKAYAKFKGYSKKEIDEAMTCLKEKRT